MTQVLALNCMPCRDRQPLPSQHVLRIQPKALQDAGTQRNQPNLGTPASGHRGRGGPSHTPSSLRPPLPTGGETETDRAYPERKAHPASGQLSVPRQTRVLLQGGVPAPGARATARWFSLGAPRARVGAEDKQWLPKEAGPLRGQRRAPEEGCWGEESA